MLFVAASGGRKIERIPALLIEVGFISNAAERQMIIDNPQVYAKGIGEGLYAILADIKPMFV